MDKTTKKLNFVQEKLGKLLKTNGNYHNNCRYGADLYYRHSVCYPDSYALLGYLCVNFIF